jgi:hypothetical protein
LYIADGDLMKLSLGDILARFQGLISWFNAGLVCLVLGACALITAIDIHTSLEDYDDEGLVLSGLYNYKSGLEPYTQFDTQYGPGLFELYRYLFPSVESVTLNHSRRITSLLVGGALLLLGLQTGWTTRNAALAGAAILLAFTVLYARPREPIHPNWPVLALVMLVMVLFLHRASFWRMAIAGALTAVLFLIKINAGILVAAAICLA